MGKGHSHQEKIKGMAYNQREIIKENVKKEVIGGPDIMSTLIYLLQHYPRVKGVTLWIFMFTESFLLCFFQN